MGSAAANASAPSALTHIPRGKHSLYFLRRSSATRTAAATAVSSTSCGVLSRHEKWRRITTAAAMPPVQKTGYASPPSPVTPLRRRAPRTSDHGCSLDVAPLRAAGHGQGPPATGKNRRATGKTATTRSQGHGDQRARPTRGAPRNAPRYAHRRTPRTGASVARRLHGRDPGLHRTQGAPQVTRPCGEARTGDLGLGGEQLEGVRAAHPGVQLHRYPGLTKAGAATDRMAARWPNCVLVRTPVHTSWLDRSRSSSPSCSARSSRPTTAAVLTAAEGLASPRLPPTALRP